MRIENKHAGVCGVVEVVKCIRCEISLEGVRVRDICDLPDLNKFLK